MSSQYSVPAFKTGFNVDCTLTSEGSIGAGTMNVSTTVSGVPDGPVVRSATARSPGWPNKYAAKSAPVKSPADIGVNAAAISKLVEPKGVVRLPTTQPTVPKLSPGPRLEKITPAFADAAIPAIRILIAILIGLFSFGTIIISTKIITLAIA
jgi:hypothetical protein